MKPDIFISERFRRAVTLHLVKNLSPSADSTIPLILGIHGPSGYGKTFQCERILKELGAKAFLISGGQLEDERAGEPGRLIRAMYINAGKCLQNRESNAAVVVLNDFDAGVGSFGALYQYTVNRQNVFAELMHLVDYPRDVEGLATRRIPLIITGNDFTKLYEPLVRAGRMTAFPWIPESQEMASIVAGILPELPYQDCERLVQAFPHQPVAFFSVLRSTMLDDHLYGEIKRHGAKDILAYFSNGETMVIDQKLKYETLIQTGRSLEQSGAFINHLRG